MKHIASISVGNGLQAYPYMVTHSGAAILSPQVKWTPLKLVDGSITTTSVYKNNHTLFTHKLSATFSDQDMDIITDTPIFLITDTSGEQYLLGKGMRPWPMINTNDSSVHSASSQVKQGLDITLTCHYDLMRIL